MLYLANLKGERGNAVTETVEEVDCSPEVTQGGGWMFVGCGMKLTIPNEMLCSVRFLDLIPFRREH